MSSEPGSLTIIGSVHLSEAYFDHIRSTIAEQTPDVVAVELDTNRFQSMASDSGGRPSLREIFSEFSATAGILYTLLMYSQRRLAKQLGLDPEMSDQRVAVEEAARHECEVALIDRDITRTLERVADNVSPMTLWRVWQRSDQLDEDDWAIVDEIEETLLSDGLADTSVLAEYRDLLETCIPEFTEAFLHERDRLMAQRLHALEQQGDDVVAVIGGAHEPGVQAELRQLREQSTEPETEPASTPVFPRYQLHTQ